MIFFPIGFEQGVNVGRVIRERICVFECQGKRLREGERERSILEIIRVVQFKKIIFILKYKGNQTLCVEKCLASDFKITNEG